LAGDAFFAAAFTLGVDVFFTVFFAFLPVDFALAITASTE
jgi:hypothetical protein